MPSSSPSAPLPSSPSALNEHTYTHNQWEASNRFYWKVWVGDLLSPRCSCLPFLQNPRLQLSTPWPTGMVRSHHSGHTKIKVQTMILTNVMILVTATCLPPLASHLLPPASHLPVPSSCNLPSLWIEYAGANIWVYSQVRLGVTCLLRVYLAASWECTWERTVKQAGRVSSSAIGTVLESMLWRLIESVLRAYLGAYSQEGWQCAIESNWECLESVPGHVQLSRLGVCHWVQLGASWELTCECTVKQAGSVPSSAIRSILKVYLEMYT